MKRPYFPDRARAGQWLARALSRFADREDVTVLGIPRGGALVAFEVARTLRVPLDVFLVEPIPAPGRDVALGSVGWPPSHQLHEAIVNALRLTDEAVRQAMALARRRLRQRLHVLRPLAPVPGLEGRTVLLVDEGVGKGLRLRDAAGLARRAGARTLVAAVPVGAREGLRLLADEFDDVACPWEAETFDALSLFYKDFPAVSDAQVYEVLSRAWRREPPRPEAAAVP